MVDSKPLTQEEIIKVYKDAFGYGSQVVTIDKIFRFARLIEQLHGIKNVH
jgi:hypothetical protein